MKPHLARWLTSQGHLGEWHGRPIGRKAQLLRCRSCKRPIIVGDDHHRCAVTVALDPTPINDQETERNHWALDRPTYAFNGTFIHPRWPGISTFPPPPGVTIHHRHECGDKS